jgi:glycosyltransferase involved in cell wall biosynthesis
VPEMRRIAISHPLLGRGGSEARVMWGLDGLKGLGRLSLLTLGPVDLQSLNSAYGTSVQDGDFVVRRPRMGRLLEHMKAGDALRGCLYQRFCRSVAREFDVLVCAYNLCDFGVPAIHFIADFCWDEALRSELHPAVGGARGLFHRGLLRKAYLGLSRSLAKPSGRNLFAGEDVIIANSRWSADILRKRHAVAAEVLYPPVPGVFPSVPPVEKENGFVCLGRIAPEKRVEEAVKIVEAVRSRGHDVHLHVIGKMDGHYGDSIRGLCESRKSWVSLEGPLYGKAKSEMLSRHRYAIHACRGEAFGIAVAEMVKAGCVPFVPSEGGVAEIVASPELTYEKADEAVAKIDAVLRTPSLEASLRERLAIQAQRFSPELFKAGIRDAVEQFLARKREREAGR